VEGLGAGLSSIEVRTAVADDEEQIVALQCERNGADCDAPLRELLRRPGVGPDRFAVAVEDGRVVSSLCLIPERFRIGGVSFGVGQVEYVATASTHERRGLVRSLMDVAHRWSREDGHLAEVIAGIRYFYRRFGYEYAAPFPRVWLPGPPPATPSGFTVRPATAADAEVIVELQRAAVDGVALACLGGDVAWWRRRLAGELEPRWYVAEDRGGVGGVASIGHGPPGVPDVALLGAPAVGRQGAEALAALAALLQEAAKTGRTPAVQARPHIDPLVSPWSTLHPRQYSLYVRIGDPIAFLDHLRPALTDRLRASSFASIDGDLLVGFYERSALLTFARGEVTGVAARPGAQEPERDGIGIPPDVVATLLFGKHAVAGLAARYEDVALGDHADLAGTLFPALKSDLTLV
jgi:predicted N-acetyltransferase YhbS